MAYVVLEPRPESYKAQKFGRGVLGAKIVIVVVVAMLLSLGAWFRAATNYLVSHPVTSPAWYQRRPCYYVFNFTIEVLVVYIYISSCSRGPSLPCARRQLQSAPIQDQ